MKTSESSNYPSRDPSISFQTFQCCYHRKRINSQSGQKDRRRRNQWKCLLLQWHENPRNYRFVEIRNYWNEIRYFCLKYFVRFQLSSRWSWRLLCWRLLSEVILESHKLRMNVKWNSFCLCAKWSGKNVCVHINRLWNRWSFCNRRQSWYGRALVWLPVTDIL